jgi:outer membrane protein TolC
MRALGRSRFAMLCLLVTSLAERSALSGDSLPAPPAPSPSPRTESHVLPPAISDTPIRREQPEGAAGLDRALPIPPSLLSATVAPIDLNTALALAGVQNPDLLLARQRVVEAMALRQVAAVQMLPSINMGMNYDTHTGVLQQSNGNILTVNRSAVYVGAGANAVAAGTVNIPGIILTGNPAAQIYAYLASRQLVQEREFATIAMRNQVLLRVALAYSELLRAEGERAVALQVRDEGHEVARLTAAYVLAGEGRQADADRAATEYARRQADVQAAEGRVLVASARLAEVLNIDPSLRLHPTDASVVPFPIVPDPIPISELIALALLQRPELAERRAAIRGALLTLDGAKLLPFSPNLLIGMSAGGFGGGSNLVRPVFGGFGGRTDFDAVGYWTLQNLGVGNLAMINLARSRLKASEFREIAVLDQVRAEVAEAYARTHARFAQIATTESAVRAGTNAYREDLLRIRERARNALPIELLDSFRLLARARTEYVAAIVDYNEAQFELYVALGQPPANALARPVPTEGVVPTDGLVAPVPSQVPNISPPTSLNSGDQTTRSVPRAAVSGSGGLRTAPADH